MVKYNRFLLFLFVCLAPLLSLIARQVVWGADSFAFMSVACGKPFIQHLGHPLFAVLVPLFQCNFLLIILCMTIIYSFGLLGIWIFGNFVLKSDGWKLPIVVGAVSPLFFIEALRFENQLFGFSLAFVGLGLFCLYLTTNKTNIKLSSLFLSISAYLIASLFWFPSIIIAVPCFLLLKIPKDFKNIGLGFMILTGTILYGQTIIYSFVVLFTEHSLVAEAIPLVGIVFILHIVHLYKYVPKTFYYWNILLIIAGLIQTKYMFLSIPFLAMGVIRKDHEQGLIIRGNRIQLIPVCIFLLIGYFIMAQSMYPTMTDVKEIDYLISRAESNDLNIYNDWGEGWLFEWRGYQTEYKKYRPQPDFNSLPTPFYAFTKFPEELPDGCVKLTKFGYFCQ